MEIRAGDGQGHVLTDLKEMQRWGGVVDSFAPRITLVREPHPTEPDMNVIAFDIYDTMLDPDSIHQNLCEGIELTKEYFNSAWFFAGGIAPNSALYRISGSCVTTAITTEETGIVACDTAGNCVGETFPAVLNERVYLPMVVGGGSGAVDILPKENPKLESLLAEAETWPKLSDSLALYYDLPRPEVWLVDDTITHKDVRSIVHINVHGAVVNSDSVDKLEVAIWQKDEMIVQTHASIYGDVWNAFWPFKPGEPPNDGTYRLELIVTDKSGEQFSVWETLNVSLKP